MWMDERMRELKERISNLSDDELLNIVEVEFDDYRKEAIDFAKDELTRRGIEFDVPEVEEERPTLQADSVEQRANPEVDTSWAETCARCGGKTRLGVLVENKEITILFSDKDEQRFLEVYACTGCGYVQMAVDFENEVEME